VKSTMRNVIILGSGRSGTSMLAGTLAAAGYELGGPAYPAREANPKGFFETHAVNGVNELILAATLPRHPRLAAGQRWLAELAPGTPLVTPPEAAARLARLVERAPYCFKDPRFCHTLPAWEPALGDALRLCIFREPAATARSIVQECKRERYLRSLRMTPHRALQVWTNQYRRVIDELAARGTWRFVHYEQLFDPAFLEELAGLTGARLDAGFAERRLERSHSDAAVPAETAAVYAELCARAGHTPRRAIAVQASAATPAPQTGAPRVSVILCTYNRRPILEQSIASFAAQRAPRGSFELILVNDGSRDGTREYLDGLALDVPFQVLHQPNQGLATARNTGIAAARGEYFLFVNDDTLAHPDCLAEHLAAHAAYEAAHPGQHTAVLGTFEQPLAALDNALMRYLEVSDFVFRYADMQAGELYDYQRFWTCNVSVRAAEVRAAGGFDERFRVYGAEDIDLGFRLAQRGVPVLYHPRARADHSHLLNFADLKKRQRLCASSFVHLFHKEPRCLTHPDWSWATGRSVAELERAVDLELARVPALEAAAAELSRVDLGALDAAEAGAGELVGAVLTRLDGLMKELNALWWQAGFADGLRQFGYAGFADLLARVPLPSDGAGVLDEAGFEQRIEDWRELAAGGEHALATIEGGRLLHAVRNHRERGAGARRQEAQLLNDLGVLRYGARDGTGALALFEAALALEPDHELARANLDDVRAASASFAPRWGEGPDAQALPTSLNPWVKEALKLGDEACGFAGREVLEIGGAIPAEAALALRPARWVAGYPRAERLEFGPYTRLDLDARALRLPDRSFDLIFSSCAFEHINDFEQALGEMRRVLRPGGAIVTHFAPIWSCAVGHHLWETDGQGRRIMFLDRVVPDFAHLLWSEAELATYLGLVLGAEAGRRATDYVVHHACINRVCEGEFRRLFKAAGFDTTAVEALAPWDAAHVPSARLAAEIRRLHPTAGDCATPGLRGVLRKPADADQPALELELAGVEA